MPFIYPTHQGRAAEGIMAEALLKEGDIIPNNSHFDTTRANIEYKKAKAINLLYDSAYNTESSELFKGNINLKALEELIKKEGVEKIPFCMITLTNNTGGGQPVSMKNIRELKSLLTKYRIPLIIDCCRFAENSYFIKINEKGYQNKTLMEIAQETFSYADAATMSAKKDGLANIGGFLITRNEEWAEKFKNLLILREGFPTYGGLSGRDLETISVGLKEALEFEYQSYRNATMKYLGKSLEKYGIPFIKPVGGHAVFLDAKRFLPNIASLEYPGISLVNAIYIEGGIRTVELGSVMFGKILPDNTEIPSNLELVRLAIPRRVYTQSHFDYLIEVLKNVYDNRNELKGYKITYQPKFLRHFTCHFEQVESNI